MNDSTAIPTSRAFIFCSNVPVSWGIIFTLTLLTLNSPYLTLPRTKSNSQKRTCKQFFSLLNPLLSTSLPLLVLRSSVGSGPSAAAVGAIYKCPQRPWVVHPQPTYALHVSMFMCVFVHHKNPQERSELTGSACRIWGSSFLQIFSLQPILSAGGTQIALSVCLCGFSVPHFEQSDLLLNNVEYKRLWLVFRLLTSRGVFFFFHPSLFIS